MCEFFCRRYCLFLCFFILQYFLFFFFKQNTAYEMRISDWSSDVCSSDLSNDRTQTRDRWSCLKRLLPRSGCCACQRLGPKQNRFSPDRTAACTGESSQIGRASCRERVCQYV